MRSGRDRRPAPQCKLDQAAADQHEHEVGADERSAGRGRDQIEGPARPAHAVGPHALVARDEQRASGVHGDGRHGRARAGSGAAHPERGRVPEEQHGQQQDGNDGGNDEPEPADDRAERAADAVGAEDRELRRGRPRQETAGRVGVLELLRVHPALALDHQAAQQHDVRRWPAEPGHADAGPFARDRGQWRGGRVRLLERRLRHWLAAHASEGAAAEW